MGREGKKTLNLMGRQSLCYGKIGEKFWGAEKTGLLILPGKQKKKFRDLVALEQGLEGQRTSLHSRQERKLQTHRSSTCKVTKKKKRKKKKKKKNLKEKKKTSKSTIPPSPDNLENDPPPTLWVLPQVYLITIRSFITSHCSVTYSAGIVGLYKDIYN